MERMFIATITLLLLLALLIFLPSFEHWQSLKRPLGDAGIHRAVSQQDVKVWINRRSGFYYCRDSSASGHLGPGMYLGQGEAVQRGYSPYFGQMCPAD